MELLKKLYGIYSPSKGEEPMRKFLKSYCKKMGYKYWRNNGNIYVTKGVSETYPCVVAHMDQVQRFHSKDFKVIENDGLLFGYSRMSRRCEGLGADDKNGIWVALKCLERFDVMKCAFFWGEEIGCEGSEMAYMKFFDDCRFVLQCDRRNGGDFITNIGMELCSEEFINDVPLAEFGYAETHGAMTDVEILKSNGLKVSCCNMSCGYYSPHTDEETTEFGELLNCLEFVSAIITRCTKVYPHEYVSRFDNCYSWSYRDYPVLADKPKRKPEKSELRESLYDELVWAYNGEYPLSWKAVMDDFKSYFQGLSKNDFKEVVESYNREYGMLDSVEPETQIQ